MIPIYGRTVGFNFFDDFGMDMALRDSQLRQSPEGIDALDSPLYGCPNYVNGTCQGGQQIKFNPIITPIPGTNYVPRDSAGGELDVMMPIINAPFRIYYAYNALRLDGSATPPVQITRGMFPCPVLGAPNCQNYAAGNYTYSHTRSTLGSSYTLLEPRKTFRFTVATTF